MSKEGDTGIHPLFGTESLFRPCHTSLDHPARYPAIFCNPTDPIHSRHKPTNSVPMAELVAKRICREPRLEKAQGIVESSSRTGQSTGSVAESFFRGFRGQDGILSLFSLSHWIHPRATNWPRFLMEVSATQKMQYCLPLAHVLGSLLVLNRILKGAKACPMTRQHPRISSGHTSALR